MRCEPSVNRERLIAVVRAEYQIPAEKLDFVPVGFDAACYVLHCAGGQRYFLKLWPELRLGQAAAHRRYGSLTLARALCDRGLLRRVPSPIPAQTGALWADLSEGPFALFPLLPGTAAPRRMPVALRDEFARTIAVIHRATPALADVLPPRETFAIPDEAGLNHRLAVVARIGSERRPGLRALRRLLLPREAEIRAQYARLRELQTTVRRSGGPFVLCHSDLGGDNMLVDEDGSLSVLDWDFASVAPPEFDLWSLLPHGFAQALAVYREAGGAGPLQLDRFAFCMLRRYLGDMLARLERLLDGGTAAASEEKDEELLRGMEAYGFVLWATLDATLSEIAAAL
ncbi:MAG TPA: phosphotransferase [Dehalococcoidia bacterium]|nr:phosphotransferase [Dehalococcoidia bacterium]